MKQRRVFRKLSALAAAFLLVFMGTVHASAEKNEKENISPRLFLSEIQEMISDYVSANTVEKVAMLNSDSVSSNVREDAALRAQALTTMESRIGCVFDRVTVTAEIDSFSGKDNGSIEIQAYEITAIDYHYEDVPDSADFCAIGVWHTIELEKTENGYRIVKDSYDERDVTGAASKDKREGITEYDSDETSSPDVFHAIEEPSRYNSLQIVNLLQYAVQYCGFSQNLRRNGVSDSQYTASGIGNTTYYNSAYNHSEMSTKDCANYVSQCLYAGGFRDNTGTWAFPSSYWVNAKKLANFLISCGYSSVSANGSSYYANVFPGNPVYWINPEGSSSSGHQMICVGYNSAGVPVVCAHTSDAYRVPISTFYATGRTVMTIQMATSNLHSLHVYSTSYYGNEYQHHKVCTRCEFRGYIGSHSVTAGVCTICGSSGPFVY